MGTKAFAAAVDALELRCNGLVAELRTANETLDGDDLVAKVDEITNRYALYEV